MARYFAELDKNDTVIRVIVCESREMCEQLFGGVWQETWIDGNYAGKGWTWHPDTLTCSSPQPYPSWTLSPDKTTWEPPVPKPHGEAVWVESNRAWRVEQATINGDD